MYGIHLSQPGQFMYSFSIGNLPSTFSVNNDIHSCNTRHASFFFYFLSVGQSWGSFLYAFKALSFELILFCEET